jgi:hypothetical protein
MTVIRCLSFSVAVVLMLFVATYFIGLDGRHPDMYMPYDLPRAVMVQR